MSVLGSLGHGLARAGARIAAHPMAFAFGTLLSAFALAIPIFVALLVYGALPWIEQQQARAEVTVFMNPGASTREAEVVRALVAAMEGADGVRLVARGQAGADLAKRYGLNALTAEDRPSPLPDVLIVRMKSNVDPQQVARVATATKELPGVGSVRSDLDWYRRYQKTLRLVSTVAGTLAAATLVLVLLVVALAVRAQCTVDSAEVRVLQLLGATRAFIARPSVCLAIISVTLATAFGLAAAALGVTLVGPQLETLPGWSGRLRLPPLWSAAAALAAVCVFGAAVGWLSAERAIRSARSQGGDPM